MIKNHYFTFNIRILALANIVKFPIPVKNIVMMIFKIILK